MQIQAGVVGGRRDPYRGLGGLAVGLCRKRFKTVNKRLADQCIEIVRQCAIRVDLRYFQLGWQCFRIPHGLGKHCPGQALLVLGEKALLANNFVFRLQSQHFELCYQA